MKERVQQILERELDKLFSQSNRSEDGLPLADVRRLEVLIKCYNAYIGPLETPDDPSAPKAQSTDALLQDVLGGIHK